MLVFERLWSAYPSDYAPCRANDDLPNFDNQCAIRVGIALRGGGADLSSYDGVKCWHGHGNAHFLRGEELADWMSRQEGQFGKPNIRLSSDASTYLGKRGVMFCRNFWGPGNQGDHIDLWDRRQLAMGDPGYILRSDEVWFWDIDALSA